MKFKVGDQVLVTGGKDKGKKGKITAVFAKENRAVVENVNMYVKHRKPLNGQPGERLVLPRPLPTANFAILNNEGKQDRVGYQVNKSGEKIRIYKKTGKAVPELERTNKKK